MPALIGKIENACADSGAKQAKSPAEGKVAKELFHDDFLFLDDETTRREVVLPGLDSQTVSIYYRSS